MVCGHRPDGPADEDGLPSQGLGLLLFVADSEGNALVTKPVPSFNSPPFRVKAGEAGCQP